MVAAAEGNRILVVEYDGQSDMKEKAGIIKEILERESEVYSVNNERYKYPPIDALDIKEIEVWLEEMAGRGLFLKEAGPYVMAFAEEEPKTVRYRIEPAAGKKENWMPIGRRTMKLWDGIMWQKYNTYYHIFMADHPETEEELPYGSDSGELFS